MLISKNDIKEFTQFSINIEDRVINHNILDAQEYDLKPVVGDLMYFDLKVYEGMLEWSLATTYQINMYVVFKNKVYKSLNINTNAQPNLNPLNWIELQLGNFFYNFLRPYLVFISYKKFMIWIGANVTQYGLREINEDTSIPISDGRRAELISDIKTKSNIWLSRLKNEICLMKWIFDNKDYSPVNDNYVFNNKKTFKIRPIK